MNVKFLLCFAVTFAVANGFSLHLHRKEREVTPARPEEPVLQECRTGDGEGPDQLYTMRTECKMMDEANMDKYKAFIASVMKWEMDYPEEATKWNAANPLAKVKEEWRLQVLQGFYMLSHLQPSQEKDEEMEMEEMDNKAEDE